MTDGFRNRTKKKKLKPYLVCGTFCNMDDFLIGDELIRVVTGPCRAPANQPTTISDDSGGPGNRGAAGFQEASWGTGRKLEKPPESSSSSREQSYRHMMSERLRREREKEAYADLHSMLPPGTKNEKNAIMRGATRKIEELEGYKRALERRIMELEGVVESDRSEHESRAAKKIRIKVGNPTSALDSMLEVLHLLKRLGAETTSMEWRFSRQEFVAAMDVETQMDAGEVEDAVQRSLHDTEMKLLSRVFPRTSGFENWQPKEEV